MKNIKYYLFIFLACLIITGCHEATPEENLCKKLTPNIKNYQNNKINYNEFLKLIEDDYNEYCADGSSIICLNIKSMYSNNNLDLEPIDCSGMSGSAKDLCEATNRARESMAANKGKTETAEVNNLKRGCENLGKN